MLSIHNYRNTSGNDVEMSTRVYNLSHILPSITSYIQEDKVVDFSVLTVCTHFCPGTSRSDITMPYQVPIIIILLLSCLAFSSCRVQSCETNTGRAEDWHPRYILDVTQRSVLAWAPWTEYISKQSLQMFYRVGCCNLPATGAGACRAVWRNMATAGRS